MELSRTVLVRDFPLRVRTDATMAGRIVFANQLRGVAALCVLVAHVGGVFWTAPQLVAAATFSAVHVVPLPPFVPVLGSLELGSFGVALFFLISGFVIPISLERLHSVPFLIARAFRIYPTYLVAFAVQVAFVAASAALWHRPLATDPRVVLANALLITDIANVPSLDLVNWTLTVELKFYVLMALLAVPVRRGKLWALFTAAAGILIVSRFSRGIFLVLPGLGQTLQIFESNALWLLFMLIGVVFNYHLRGKVRAPVAVLAIALLFSAFVACWPLTFFRGEYATAVGGYGAALLCFSLLYAVRDRVPNTRVADFFADISYPLYLVHSLVGFSVMQVLVANGATPLAAIGAGVLVVIPVALVLHRTVETRSQELGKALASRVHLKGDRARWTDAMRRRA